MIQGSRLFYVKANVEIEELRKDVAFWKEQYRKDITFWKGKYEDLIRFYAALRFKTDPPQNKMNSLECVETVV